MYKDIVNCYKYQLKFILTTSIVIILPKTISPILIFKYKLCFSKIMQNLQCRRLKDSIE